MYRACSTWQYLVASDLIEEYRQGRRLGFILPKHFNEANSPLYEGWFTLKLHDGHEILAELLATSRAIALYSYRDLRDVAYSLMHKLAAGFDEVPELAEMLLRNDTFWRSQPNTLIQRYETILQDFPAAVGQIARHLDLDVQQQELNKIAERYSLDANRARTEVLTKELVERGVDLADPQNSILRDPFTQLHWNHIRHGRAGSWPETASREHLRVLDEMFGTWLVEFGYETDHRWAQSSDAVSTNQALTGPA
jgi:hypothetical protein